MEDTVKALEEKLAKLEAKLGKKSESTAGTSGSSPITSPENPLRIKPESFSATSGESWVVWMRKFKSIATLNKWSPELQAQILPAYLKGLAEQTYYSLTTEQTATWTAVERALTDRFHPKESRQVHISTLRAKLRRPDEDLHQLRCDISRLVELAYPNDPPDILNRTARDFFVGALTPITLREKVLDLGPNTLDEALAAAQRYESNQKVLNKGSARVLSSTSGDPEEFGSQQGTQEPPAWAKELFQQQAEILEKLKNIPQGRQGVSVQAMSTVPVMFSYWAKPEDTLDLCRILNDDLAKIVKKHSKRFVGLGTLPMQAPQLAVQELKRCVKELGFPGVEIGSHVNDWNLDAPELDPVFAAAEELGCGVFVHPWDMESTIRTSKYWLPWLVGMPSETAQAICCMIFGGVFERYPGLKVCFAHGGGSFPFTIGRIEHGFNVRPDLCAVENNVSPRKYIGQIFTDSLVHDENALKYLVDFLGQENVLLGSDYPFPLGEHHPGKLIEEVYNDRPQLRDKLLSGNALRFLGLKRSQFENDSSTEEIDKQEN